ncbi:MAG: NAD(P)/FAD-dependent oxidoreductase [Acidobacteria bacterium]|nr:NAD(P)/FAD-dependent oxidoreductase [Acidobacteriota bacterium]
MFIESAQIAIIGAGPAGAHLASQLADAGLEVLLFDPKGAWEKPCGGGVPTRALREFAFILESTDYPRKLIHRVTLVSANGRRVSVDVDRPFAIYSREVLNQLVLDRAINAGAKFVQAAVKNFVRSGDHWILVTDDDRAWRAEFLVGADGAASFTRRKLAGIFPQQDLALAFGYNIPFDEQLDKGIKTEEVTIQFSPDFTGYLWAFPRPGMMNFGVAAKLGERTSDELRQLLSAFVRRYYGGRMPESERLNFFGAKIPTLDYASWADLRAFGEGWALIGDAAGFCDPITGEGIYYAFKSADTLAHAFDVQRMYHPQNFQEVAALYEIMWHNYFGKELQRASQLLPRFYRGTFFGRPFPNAVIFLAAHHRGVREVLVNALIGEQSYVTLKQDLLNRAYQIF